jgi:hypothetical protein
MCSLQPAFGYSLALHPKLMTLADRRLSDVVWRDRLWSCAAGSAAAPLWPQIGMMLNLVVVMVLACFNSGEEGDLADPAAEGRGMTNPGWRVTAHRPAQRHVLWSRADRSFGRCVGETSMNFQDKRIWYGVAAVVVLLIIIWALWPAGEMTPPAAPQ